MIDRTAIKQLIIYVVHLTDAIVMIMSLTCSLRILASLVGIHIVEENLLILKHLPLQCFNRIVVLSTVLMCCA